MYVLFFCRCCCCWIASDCLETYLPIDVNDGQIVACAMVKWAIYRWLLCLPLISPSLPLNRFFLPFICCWLMLCSYVLFDGKSPRLSMKTPKSKCFVQNYFLCYQRDAAHISRYSAIFIDLRYHLMPTTRIVWSISFTLVFYYVCKKPVSLTRYFAGRSIELRENIKNKTDYIHPDRHTKYRYPRWAININNPFTNEKENETDDAEKRPTKKKHTPYDRVVAQQFNAYAENVNWTRYKILELLLFNFCESGADATALLCIALDICI